MNRHLKEFAQKAESSMIDEGIKRSLLRNKDEEKELPRAKKEQGYYEINKDNGVKGGADHDETKTSSPIKREEEPPTSHGTHQNDSSDESLPADDSKNNTIADKLQLMRPMRAGSVERLVGGTPAAPNQFPYFSKYWQSPK